ncbi:MAG: flagellin lysine-N-methylase [Roseburia sp.]
MKLRIPSYYREFVCIADRCKDSCCIGWGIDIDEDTFYYYQSVEGTFGERLRRHMVTEDGNSFQLEENGWCPFLNQQKLCDICIELGEEALSEVCTEYPRFTLEYGNVREKCLCLSCEEVGRILFSKKEKTTFEEIELPEEGWESDAEEEELLVESNLECARDIAISILQNREKEIVERIADYLTFCGKVQEKIADESLWKEKMDLAKEIPEHTEPDVEKRLFSYEAFLERLELLEELEVLNEEWITEKEKLHTFYERETYEKWHREFLDQEKEWEYEQEQLLVYMTFRYFMKSVYDSNFLAKAKLAVFTYLVILDLDVRRWKESGSYTRADRVDTARIYAKEVEHSEENLELLEEAFEFGFQVL